MAAEGRSRDRYIADVGSNVRLSSSVKIPNSVKVRKKVHLWPVKLSAGLDYNFEKNEVTWVASCKVSGTVVNPTRERSCTQ